MTGRPPPLPIGVKVASAILLMIPLVALLLVPTYARATPKLWGFPFFYWYQLMWVFLAAGFTSGAYLLIRRARGAGREN